MSLSAQSALTWEGTPQQDATIYAEQPRANGAGLIVVGSTMGKMEDGVETLFRRGLLAFDLSDLPAEAVVEEATLTLRVARRGPTAPSISFDLRAHRLTASWGEGVVSGGGPGAEAEAGDVTYTHRFHSDTPWTTPGGDFLTEASATTVVNGSHERETTVTLSGPGLVDDIQAWIADPSTNFGWILRGGETISFQGSLAHFYSREDTQPADLAPMLSLSYRLSDGGSTDWYGYAVDAEGWVNTESWLNWVNVTEDPYIWSTSLESYLYVPNDSGWVFIYR